MHFNRLRLTGFKSFVDPTELVIADGLTGVVGPNGCGKSNLLEALRWVMGENRPTAMRGEGMEDVIFAGSGSRPARNHAEVALFIDNAERLAPAAFNDADLIEVVRRITRDAGSAYRLNGRDMRARDIAMLFADASTGAHSPALVRQGQISELINARPKARRRILEEAAGISGLYQRRHEAELKLNAAETNLSRVADVLEGLEGQLKALERQARAAARYREIAVELRRAEGVLLWRHWREAEEERSQAELALTDATRAAGRAEAEASRLMRARGTAETAVPPLREEDAVAGAVLQRLLVERDSLDSKAELAQRTIAELTARIAQLGTDAAREAQLAEDAGASVTALEAEAVELAKAAQGHDSHLAEAEEAARTAATVLAEAEESYDRLTADAARLAARHQSAERRRDEIRLQASKIEAETSEAKAAAEQFRGKLADAQASLTEAASAQAAAMAAVTEAENALAEAEATRSEAQAADADARAALAEADGEAGTLNAELAALRRLVARDRGDGPQLIDEVRAKKGFEAALGAALGDDLKAPVATADGTGWRMLPGYDETAPLPVGAEPLGPQVKAPAALARRLAQIGVVAPDDGPRLQPELRPGQRLVSLDGDLWRWDGYAVQAGSVPSSAALQLAQMNRLAELESAAGEARARAEDCRARQATAGAALEAAQASERAARSGRRDADEAAAAAMRTLNRAESDKTALEGRIEVFEATLARREEDRSANALALRETEDAIAELGDLAGARTAAEQARTGVEAARLAMMARRAAADETRREGDAREARQAAISREVQGWRNRAETAAARVGELSRREAECRETLVAAEAVPAGLQVEREKLKGAIADAEARRKSAADALAKGETELREAEASERQAEREASQARESRARAEAVLEGTTTAVDAARHRIEEELETTPQALLESLGDPAQMPDAAAAETEVHRLRRARDALGAVNLRAEEDARAVTEEIEALATEKADLEAAIAKLRSGITALNREGRGRLVAAFEQVNRNFSALFRHLFGGGDASLVMVESEDPLEAGLEIMCQPPGKKLSTLSLLSGGEQTLTAISLIFAVFLANPSPICVLDEVDAPLDDANVGRFCDLLDEMKQRTATRFLIITHHAVTMSRMDRLFGVTMAEQGVSQLVSVDLRRAEALVEA